MGPLGRGHCQCAITGTWASGPSPVLESAFGRPTLTSIQVPMSRAGVMSVDMLHQQLSAEFGQAPAETRAVTLPTQLVVRQSTGPVAGWTPARRERNDA